MHFQPLGQLADNWHRRAALARLERGYIAAPNVILEAASWRGNLDLDGVRYVLICYGLQYQVIIPYREGHVSIGINLSDDPVEIAEKITGYLALQPADSAV